MERSKHAKAASAVAPLDSASMVAVAPSNQGALGTEQMLQVMMQDIALLKQQVAKIPQLELDHAELKQRIAKIPQLELDIATLKQTVAELSVDVRNFSVAASRINLRSLSLVCLNVTDAALDATLQSGLEPQLDSAASVLGAAANQLECRPSC
jgi:Tfp pilus assembly protein PilN